MFRQFSSTFYSLCKSLGLLAAVFFLGHAQAQGVDSRPAFLAETQLWMNNAVLTLRSTTGAAPLRMEATLGELDSRLRLAPCAKVEPYIPVGTRLWGSTRLGLRCLEGSVKWNVFLPVTVKAYGPAWVIKGDVPQGTVLTPADAMEAEVDWAEEASPIVSNASEWAGQEAFRALTTGQAIRQNLIKPTQVFQAGAQIRVVAKGRGFHIVSDGQALTAGFIGQPARVRMSGGRVMTGMVLDSRTVQLEI